VGDDDYEITGSRSAGASPPAPPAPAASAPAAGPTGAPAEAEGAEPAAEVSSGGRDNGQRFGVRFRRGSRGSFRAGDIPLIGVVQIEPSAAEALPAEAVVLEPEEPAGEAEPKPAKPKRAPRKKKAAASPAKAGKAAKAAPVASDADAAPAAPVKRGRSRAKKPE
jgi:ribonuclease E